jgi:hypothetical protein
VLFTAHSTLNGFDEANIEVMSLADHRRKTLVRGGTFGRYLPSGHLVYINKGTLFAAPFDLDTLAVRGTPSPVLDQVAYSPRFGSAQFDFSRSGTLVYESGGAAGGGLLTQVRHEAVDFGFFEPADRSKLRGCNGGRERTRCSVDRVCDVEVELKPRGEPPSSLQTCR